MVEKFSKFCKNIFTENIENKSTKVSNKDIVSIDKKTEKSGNNSSSSVLDKKTKNLIYLAQNTSSCKIENIQTACWSGLPFGIIFI